MTSDVRRCAEYIHADLVEEMGQRAKDRTLDWIERERFAVVEAANRWALAFGYPTVTMTDVERVEQMAVGHVDYATKLPLYVAELVVHRVSDLKEEEG
jgi:hypothetical protein